MPRVRAGRVERRRARADPERPGRLDAQLRPERRQAYEREGPEALHSFYATTAYPISLVFDTRSTRTASSPFRKALSLAIDRNDVSKLGEYGYAPPTDALGLNGIFPNWVTDPSMKAAAQALPTYNPTAAKKMLTDAGFTYKGSTLIDPKGNPVKLDIHVISGWSDWVASNQIITKNLQAIGIDSNVALEPDWNSWYPNASSTKYPTLLWQTASQGSPYGYFYPTFAAAVHPFGPGRARPTGNWAHFYDPKATALLNQWKASLNPEAQQLIASQLEKMFLHDSRSSRCSRAALVDVQHPYFHCFTLRRTPTPTRSSRPSPTTSSPSRRICPGGKAGA